MHMNNMDELHRQPFNISSRRKIRRKKTNAKTHKHKQTSVFNEKTWFLFRNLIIDISKQIKTINQNIYKQYKLKTLIIFTNINPAIPKR